MLSGRPVRNFDSALHDAADLGVGGCDMVAYSALRKHGQFCSTEGVSHLISRAGLHHQARSPIPPHVAVATLMGHGQSVAVMSLSRQLRSKYGSNGPYSRK